MRTRSLRLGLASTLAALLTACGGSGGGSLPVTTLTPAPTTSSSPGSTQSANVQFVIAIPALPSTSSARTRSARPMDFSSSTQSVKIALGTNVLGTSNVTATSSLCKAATGGGRTCTIGVTAPTGNDQFAITAYDQPNGAGNAIAQGMVGATVSSQASTVNVTVSGTIAKIALSLSNPYPPIGTAATVNVVVTGYDIDGNAVLGAYPSTVTLSDSDASGATSLSATTLSSSTTPVTLNYTGVAPFGSATITASLSGVTSATAAFAPTPAFLKTYAVPQVSAPWGTTYPGVWNMAKGPDGNMWICTTGYSEIIKVAPDGTMTPYSLPSGSGDQLTGMVAGSDGNMWFAETGNNAIGKITTAGVVTEYQLPYTIAATPDSIGLGPDGNIWFEDGWNQVIGKITTSGAVTEYPEPAGDGISGITSGPDGNLWVTDTAQNTIQKVSTSGQFLASYPLTGNALPEMIVTGPDGNLWFTEFNTSKLGRLTPSGTLAEFPIASTSGAPMGITSGPDGRIWYSEIGSFSGFGKIGYMSVDGKQTRDFFGDGYKVHDLAFDSHGTLWYIELLNFRGAPENVGTFAY